MMQHTGGGGQRKKKKKITLNLSVLVDKPTPIAPKPSKDIVVCHIDGREPPEDDYDITNEQFRNKEQFKEIERRMGRNESIFCVSPTKRRQMPDFKREEAPWRTDDLLGRIHLKVNSPQAFSRVR